MDGLDNYKSLDDFGTLFVDPETLPGYKPAKKVFSQEALEYARKVREEENREVTFEEMQKFAIR